MDQKNSSHLARVSTVIIRLRLTRTRTRTRRCITGASMPTLPTRCSRILVWFNAPEFLSPSSAMATFATGGYVRGLQTTAMMHKIDTDGDGTVSHDEFTAYQSKVFDLLDKNKKGSVGPQEFLGK
jgi:EF hand